MYEVKLVVLNPFRSVTDHKTVHSKGDTVKITDIKRVNDMVKRGFAEIVSIEDATDEGTKADGAAADGGNQQKAGDPGKVAFGGNDYDPQTIKEALVAIGVPCAPNAGVKSLTSKVAELTEDQKAELTKKLNGNDND